MELRKTNQQVWKRRGLDEMTHIFYCRDCNVKIEGPTKIEAFELLRNHVSTPSHEKLSKRTEEFKIKTQTQEDWENELKNIKDLPYREWRNQLSSDLGAFIAFRFLNGVSWEEIQLEVIKEVKRSVNITKQNFVDYEEMKND